MARCITTVSRLCHAIAEQVFASAAFQKLHQPMECFITTYLAGEGRTDGAPDAPEDVHKVRQEEPCVCEGRILLGGIVQTVVPQDPRHGDPYHPVDHCGANQSDCETSVFQDPSGVIDPARLDPARP